MVLYERPFSALEQFRPTTIGFDRMFDSLATSASVQQNYPPYNLIKVDEDNYKIEMAVAGFNKEEIDVEVKDNKVTITGDKNPQEEEGKDFIHKGIGTRKFQKIFSLSEFVQVKGADLVNGILIIDFVRIVPEERKPRKIPLGASV